MFLPSVQQHNLLHSPYSCHISRLTSIVLAFVVILLLSTFPSWQEPDDASDVEDGDSLRTVPKPYPSRPVMKVALGSLAISILFCFISVLLQHVASAAGSAMVEALSYGTVNGKVGPAAMVLGWAGELLYLISAAGVIVMTLAVSALART